MIYRTLVESCGVCVKPKNIVVFPFLVIWVLTFKTLNYICQWKMRGNLHLFTQYKWSIKSLRPYCERLKVGWPTGICWIIEIIKAGKYLLGVYCILASQTCITDKLFCNNFSKNLLQIITQKSKKKSYPWSRFWQKFGEITRN